MARRGAPARGATETPATETAPASAAPIDAAAHELTQEEAEAEIARIEDEDRRAAEADAIAAAPAVPDAADDVFAETVSDETAALLRLRTPAQRRLLAEACYVFGINPDPRARPVELAAWRFDAGDPTGPSRTPPSVSIVTAGGLKVRYPIDDDTETRLRAVYRAFTIDRKTQQRIDLPLPHDLSLPRENIDGVVRSHEHQYRTGYLREGGREGDRRKAALDELRAKGRVR